MGVSLKLALSVEAIEAELIQLLSGVGCDVLQEVLERSGMAWRRAGGQGILTLRAWLRSEQFDAAWQIITQPVAAPAASADSYAEPRFRLVA